MPVDIKTLEILQQVVKDRPPSHRKKYLRDVERQRPHPDSRACREYDGKHYLVSDFCHKKLRRGGPLPTLAFVLI